MDNVEPTLFELSKQYQFDASIINQGQMIWNVRINDDYFGYTPMMHCVFNDYVHGIQVLLSMENIDLNKRSTRGMTVLMLALTAYNSPPHIVDLLLHQYRKIDFRLCDASNRTILDLAKINGEHYERIANLIDNIIPTERQQLLFSHLNIDDLVLIVITYL
jgi:hypothetical protein